MKKKALKLSTFMALLLLTLQAVPALGQDGNSAIFEKESLFLGIPPENIISVNADVPFAGLDTLLTVPDNCSFMITDLTITPIDTSGLCLIRILTSVTPQEIMMILRTPANGTSASSNSVTMSSGIPVAPGTPIIASNPALSVATNVTLSGYVFGCSQ